MSEAARWLTPPPKKAPERLQADTPWLRSIGLSGIPRGTFAFWFSSTVRSAFRAPSGIRPSQWAERYFVVTEGSRPGPWRNANAPYLAGIMDAWAEPYVRDVAVCAAPQLGKSKIAEIVLGYIADRDPALAQYIVPDEATADDLVEDRLKPMFEASSRLSALTTGRPGDMTKKRLKLKNMSIQLAWAGSVTRLARVAAKFQIEDEVDKFPASPSKKEASTDALIKKRQRTFRWDRKNLKISSPTTETGPIWLAWLRANARFYWFARCPDCGCEQRLVSADQDGRPRLRWPDDVRDPDQIQDDNLAWYECERCGAHWDDATRDRAVAHGEWREERTGLELFAHLRRHRPPRIAFHLSAHYSPFVSLSETASALLTGTKDKTAFKDYCNGYEATPWRDYTAERAEKGILALADERPRGLVPGGGRVACLVAGVDTQQDGFVYVIRAVGWGMERETWLVREGVVDSFEALARVLWQDSYRDAAGGEHQVRLAVQDSQGDKTSQVYDFCVSNRGLVLPLKGERRMTRPFSFSTLEIFPGTDRAIPGGLKLLRADTTFFKNRLSGKLAILPTDPGAFHLHAETTEDYARQMCAEYFDEEEGAWMCPPKRANHFWDCEVYGLVAAEVLGVQHWSRDEEDEPEDDPAYAATAGSGRPGLPGWFQNRGR